MEKKQNLFHFNKIKNLTQIPIIELCGRNRLLIENHLGVLTYGMEEIRIKVNYGCMQIIGRDLKLMELCREQLVIIGQIDTLHILGG